MKSKTRLLSLTKILTGSGSSKGNVVGAKESVESDSSGETHDGLDEVKDVNCEFYDNIEQKRGWPLFSKVFMVSALKDDGVEDLRVSTSVQFMLLLSFHS